MLSQICLPNTMNLHLDRVEIVASDSLCLTVTSTTSMGKCPKCGQYSSHRHSQYWRELADLPCSGRMVTIRLHANGKST